MNPTIKNIVAVLIGIVLGSVVNMGLITASGHLIAPPPGVNLADMDSLKASMHLFEPKHFLMPFLAHAVGSLAGAFGAAKLAANRSPLLALIVGGFFLLGGIASSFMLPAPAWFIGLDVLVAYLPMAWLGCKLAGKPAYRADQMRFARLSRSVSTVRSDLLRSSNCSGQELAHPPRGPTRTGNRLGPHVPAWAVHTPAQAAPQSGQWPSPKR